MYFLSALHILPALISSFFVSVYQILKNPYFIDRINGGLEKKVSTKEIRSG